MIGAFLNISQTQNWVMSFLGFALNLIYLSPFEKWAAKDLITG